MDINWHEMTKQVSILQETLKYPFIGEFYPMSWPEIAAYGDRLLRSDPRHRMDGYANFLAPLFPQVQAAGFQSLIPLALRLSSTESIVATAQACEMSLHDFDRLVYFLTYWLLPRNFYMRDLVKKGDKQAGEYCAALRKAGYPNSLDLLQKARTRTGRAALSAETGVPLDDLTRLVHRADLSRAGSGPNMVNNYTNAGFDTLEKLVNSELDDLVDKVSRYLATLGKVPKYGMDLPAHRAQMMLMPRVVEE